MCIDSVMPSSHLIFYRLLLLLPPIPPSIRVFSNESTLRTRWPKYWSFNFFTLLFSFIKRLFSSFSLSCTGEGNGNPLQYYYLENPRDRGAWWAAIYGVAQSRTQLKQHSNNSKEQWDPTPVLFPGKLHGWRSLVGYSPWGHKELDRTEELHYQKK